MARGQTIRERFYKSPPPGTEKLVNLWSTTLTNKLLTLVWEAYDQLHKDFFSGLDWSEDYDDLERSITRELELVIHEKIDGFLPIKVQHGAPEYESRAPSPARPPEYDIAFVWQGDTRIMWPLEAKVLKTDRATETNLGDYVATLNDRFLTCYYAPFSNGGAMLGYLKQGDPSVLLESLASKLSISLADYDSFLDKHHKISNHSRRVPPDKEYPELFCCHHLVLLLE